MGTSGGARLTVIAAVIGIAAGFVAVALAAGLVLAVGLSGLSALDALDGPAGGLWPLLPCLCLSAILGFSVWLQAWTRGLRYRWLTCTLASLTGALVAAGVAWLLVWLPGHKERSPFDALGWLPAAAGLAGDFGGIGLLLGLRERRWAWFFLPALAFGAALPVTCGQLFAAEPFFAVFLVPLAPIAYFSVFHIFLDLLWRSGGDAGPDGGVRRKLRIARWSLLGVFVGLPALWWGAAFASGPTVLEAESLVHGDAPKLREALEKKPSLVTATDRLGNTLLHKAASVGERSTVELLLEKGADVNRANSFGETPLHNALKRQAYGVAGGGVEVAELLLKHKANPNASGKLHETPLYIACEANHEGLFEMLIEAGADPNLAKGGLERTPLHEAGEHGRAAVAEVLLKHGADVNARDYREATPLHDAVERSQLAMVELLLKHKADPNAESRSCGRPSEIAMKKGLPKIAEVLRAHGAQEKSAPGR